MPVASMFKHLGSTVEEVARKLVDIGYPAETAVRVADGTLPMDYASRMQRAMDQGYDIDRPMYHGTADDIFGFEPSKLQSRDAGFIGKGVYATESPYIANKYSQSAIPSYVDKSGTLSDSNVIPLVTRGGDDDYYNFDLIGKATYGRAVQKDPSFADKMTDFIKGQGKIGARVLDSQGNVIEQVNQSSGDVKSLLSAAFDPDYKGSSLLGGSAGLGILGGLLADYEEEERKRGLLDGL